MVARKFCAVLSLLVVAASTSQGAERFEHFAPDAPDPEPNFATLWALPSARPTVDVQIYAADLENDVRALSGAQAVTLAGRELRISERSSETGLAHARIWLAQQYEALGFVTSEQNGWGGSNFVAEKRGVNPDQFVIISSHLDGVENVPGADDDASGTATALAIARALAPYAFQNSIRIVAFDKEEDGLVGSAAYVDALQEASGLDAIIGVLHLEMTGYDPHHQGNIHSIDCNKRHSTPLSAHVMDAIVALDLPLHRVSGCTSRSDHASFWRANVPAIVVSENFFGGGGNPCYHKRCDTADKLNFNYMANIARAVGTAASALLEPVN